MHNSVKLIISAILFHIYIIFWFQNSCHNWYSTGSVSVGQLQCTVLKSSSQWTGEIAKSSECSKFAHVTPALKSLHWLRVRERIKYKVLSLTYKCITTSKPSYLSDLIAVQEPGVTRSSKLLTLRKRTVPSNRTLWNRSFRHAVPIMWNDLPDHLRALDASFRPALSHTQFHKQLKTYLFDLSYPSASCDGGRPTRKPPDP